MGKKTQKQIDGQCIYMQWEIKTCCINADSASYFSFTEGGGSNETKSGIFVVYRPTR